MADNNANGSQAEQGGQQSQQSQADNNSQSQADSSNQNSQQQQSNLTIEQALKVIEDLRKEQASNRNKLKTQETAQAKAEEERLKKQGEYQTLAEQREAELNAVKPQLETIEGKYNTLAGLLGKQIEDTIKDWSPDDKAFDPGKDAALEARLAWFNKAKDIVDKRHGAPARPGNRPNPPAAGGNGKDVAAELRATGKYQRF